MKNFLTLIIFFALSAMTLNAQTYLEESFDNGIPSDWAQITAATDGGWNVGTADGLSSAAYTITDNGTGQMISSNDDACNCDKLSDRIILSSVDLTMATEVVLKFNSFYQGLTYQGATEIATAEVSTDGGTTWTVLQELPIVAGWAENVFVSMDAYAGMSDVMVSFHYTDAGGWTYGAAIDEILIFTPSDFDIKVNGLGTSRFQLSGNSVDITTTVSNLGSIDLNSFDFSWSDGTNTYTETMTGLSIPFGGSAVVTHPIQFNVADAISYDLSIWGENPNGSMMDSNPDNNNTGGLISGVSFVPGKKMFAEEATGTWCGWCPRGWEWMDYMAENYPDDFVGVAVHNGDPMVVTAYDDGLTSFPGFSGFPSVILDRSSVIDPSALETEMAASLADIAPVAPVLESAVMDVEAMTISLEASAEFVTQLDDIDYRLNLALTEDGVTGSGNTWNQVNYYSFQSQDVADPIAGFGIDWNAAANPVNAAELEYNHVGRWLSDGWIGGAGTVPTSVVAGDEATHSFDGAFNSDWNPFNMHAIVMVLDGQSGKALNTNSASVDVICPSDLAETIETVGSMDGLMEGEIMVTMANPGMGFGGYTYTLDTGESADVGTAITGLAPGDYTITVIDAIGCSMDYTANVPTISSAQDIEALTSVRLFPNPTANVSTLSATFNESVDLAISVVNTVGQVINTTLYDQVSDIKHEINVSELPTGLYLVKMNVNNQVRTQRLMVK